MATLYTQYDINTRMSFIGCYIGNYAYWIISTETKRKNSDCNIYKLLLLIELSNIISCYQVRADEEDEGCCLTESNLDDIFDQIQRLTGLCFAPKGRIEPAEESTYFIALESNINDILLTEDGAGVLQERA